MSHSQASVMQAGSRRSGRNIGPSRVPGRLASSTSSGRSASASAGAGGKSSVQSLVPLQSLIGSRKPEFTNVYATSALPGSKTGRIKPTYYGTTIRCGGNCRSFPRKEGSPSVVLTHATPEHAHRSRDYMRVFQETAGHFTQKGGPSKAYVEHFPRLSDPLFQASAMKPHEREGDFVSQTSNIVKYSGPAEYVASSFGDVLAHEFAKSELFADADSAAESWCTRYDNQCSHAVMCAGDYLREHGKYAPLSADANQALKDSTRVAAILNDKMNQWKSLHRAIETSKRDQFLTVADIMIKLSGPAGRVDRRRRPKSQHAAGEAAEADEEAVGADVEQE